jgi:predicted RNase H-like nuclease (RuvC/YqgF family)
MPYFFLGVDSGISLGVALIDINGNLIYKNTYRNYKLYEVFKDISKYGKPIIICSDKKKPPELIIKMSKYFNCPYFKLKKDLYKHEKDDLVKNFEIELTEHEKDALASAYYVYKRYLPKILKIKRICKEKKFSEELVGKILCDLVKGIKISSSIYDKF